MSATPGNDFITLQATSSGILTGGQGDDTYLLTEHTLAGRTTPLTISDAAGLDKIQLVEGLQIVSSIVAATAAQLIVTDGTENYTININDADRFSYVPSGNFTTGEPGVTQSFQEFATQTLGIAEVPAAGTADGGAVTIGSAPPGGSLVPLPIGTSDTIVAQADVAEVFVLDVVGAFATGDNTQLAIAGFDVNEDSLRWDVPDGISAQTDTLDQLNGLDLGDANVVAVQPNVITDETTVNFGLDATGDAVTLSLLSVTEPADVDVTLV